MFSQSNNEEGRAMAYTGLGMAYNSLGEFAAALECHKEAVAILERFNNRLGLTVSLANIGINLDLLGDYSQALVYHERSLELSRQTKDDRSEGACLTNIGVVYGHIGDYPKAEYYFQQSLMISQKIGDLDGEAIGLYNIIDIYLGKGDIEKAALIANRALLIHQKLGDIQGEGADLAKLGSIYDRLGNINKAVECYKKALSICRQIGDLTGEEITLSGMAHIYFIKGQYAKALESHQEAYAIAYRIGDTEGEWRESHSIGMLLAILEKFQDAAVAYERALKQIERATDLLTGQMKSVYAEKVREIFDEYIGILIVLEEEQPDNQHAERAFTIAEKGKAQDLLEKLVEQRSLINARADAELTKQREKIYAQIDAKRMLLQRRGLADERRQEILYEKEELERRLDAVNVELRGKEAGLGQIVYPQAPDIEIVRKEVLSDHEALLEYYTGDTESYLFVITKNKYLLIPLGLEEDDLTAIINGGSAEGAELRNELNNRVLKLLDGEKRKYLYRKLIDEPLKDHVNIFSGIKKLTIIPHGPLYGLPFEVLCDEQGYLGDRFEIRYGPSALILKIAGESQGGGKGLLSVANPDFGPLPPGSSCADRKMQSMALQDIGPLCPLYAIEATGRNLQKTGGAGSQFLTGKAATKKAFLAQAPGRRSIFVGTHGLLDGEHPMYSMLAFAPGIGENGDDGRLHAYEVFGLNLKGVDLVTLAACQTGEGKPIGGSLQGLSSAFLAAGAKGLVVSLWSVDEQATAKLMELFYARLNKGIPAAQALAEAKKELRKITVPVDPHDPGKGTISYDQPYYWAGFILIGR